MSTMKTLLLACVAIFVGATMASGGLAGGVKQLSGEELKEAEQTLNTSLAKIATGEDSLKLGKIFSATVQVVSGTLHKYEVELIEGDKPAKKCNVEIWSQPWLKDGIQVTIECPGEPKLVKKHSA